MVATVDRPTNPQVLHSILHARFRLPCAILLLLSSVILDGISRDTSSLEQRIPTRFGRPRRPEEADLSNYLQGSDLSEGATAAHSNPRHREDSNLDGSDQFRQQTSLPYPQSSTSLSANVRLKYPLGGFDGHGSIPRVRFLTSFTSPRTFLATLRGWKELFH